MDRLFRNPAWLALLLLAAPARAADTPAPARPTWGKVVGWVLDTDARKPVAGARVSVEVDGAFPEEGKATGGTDPAGRFQVRAPLGKISSKFDWGRLLTMHPVSLLLSPRSVTKQTRMLDVSQVNVRVEAPGFKPFLGRVRATLVDPGAFSVTLDDVWLARADSPGASFTPEKMRREVIEDLKVEPEIAAPGEKVKITLATRLPVDRGFRYRAYLTSTATRLVENDLELKAEKTAEGTTRVLFTREVSLPKHSVDRWTELGFYLVRDQITALGQRDTKALLQVVTTPEERSAARSVADGYLCARVGNGDGALIDYTTARRNRPGYPLAHLLYGNLSLQLRRPAEAAQAFQQLVSLDPSDYSLARVRYAEALIAAGKPDEAAAQLDGAEKALGKRRVPAEVAVCRARIAAAHGKFDEADRWLTEAGKEGRIDESSLAEINLRRLQAAIAAEPSNAELRLSCARLLQSTGRREEALVQIRRGVELSPRQPWGFLDLGAALWERGQREDAVSAFRRALGLAPTNAEALLALADAYRDLGRFTEALPLYRQATQAQRLNLRARHNLGIMLYASGQLPEARVELAQLIADARDKGELVEEGLLFPGSSLYTGPKRRLVAGFSVPEAAADSALLEALADLDLHPKSGLLWQNVGSALLDLNLPGLAVPALRKAREFDPDLVETRFLLGTALRRAGSLSEARAELEATIAANPLHPRARIELAQLFSDAGELGRAHSQLAEQQRNYPFERLSRPALGQGG
jgi:tetratricopeptide (TPR) repeat protein